MKDIGKFIRTQLDYCVAIAEDIIKNEASLEVLNYAKNFAEIESPMTGEIEANWIRIAYEDTYIFLYLDDNGSTLSGDVCYRMNGYGQYRSKTIEEKDNPDEYIPMN